MNINLNSCTQSEKRRIIKEYCVKLLGGKCIVCGYDKYIGALSFHHLDPSKKETIISDKNITMGRAKKEVEKCVLVCLNCHAEIEAGLTSLE